LLDDRWRIRVVNQHDLWKAGCTGSIAGVTVAAASSPPSVAPGFSPPSMGHVALKGDATYFHGAYLGGKWGIYLRAPDIFFKLLDRCGSRLVPLGQIAEIRRGVTSGADDFFFVRDMTEEEIAKCSAGLPVAAASPPSAVAAASPPSAVAAASPPSAVAPVSDRRKKAGDEDIAATVPNRFKEKWGIRLGDTKRIRVVEAGDGSRHLIEAEYLEPEVHSLMEIDSVEIDPAKLSRKILLVSDPPEKLKGTHVLKYIKWGEREGYDQGSTVTQRAATRLWYDLKPRERGQLAWPKASQYRHVIASNPRQVILNCNLYEVYTRKWSPTVLSGILNSTLVALSKHQFGRLMGREGNLKTEIVDVEMMLVPHPHFSTPNVEAQIKEGLERMRLRTAHPLVEEFALADRQTLDDAVLKLVGYVAEAERTGIREELYGEMSRIYREIRGAEVEMQKFRRITARRDRASPHTIGEEIWEEFDKAQLRFFPADFIPKTEATETVALPAGKPKVLDDLFHRGAVQINGKAINLGSKARAEFAAKVVELGHYGPTPIPTSDRACEKALESYRRYEAQMEAKFKELAEERSADPEIQSRIVRELWKLFHASNRK
jgi:hypothetical protein